MKLLPITFASVLLLTSAARPARANAPSEESVILNKLPSLSEEDLKRVPFSGKARSTSVPRELEYEIHNPFRDRELLGVVVTVTLEAGPDGKAISFDAFFRVNVPPLKMTRGAEAIFSALGYDKVPVTIVLKEIHYKMED